MAGSEDDIGGLELCSHQDGGGTKFDCNGNDNVREDLGASYVFVSSVGDVDGCRLSVEENCEIKGDCVVGNDQDFAMGMDKNMDLPSEFVGEVSESAMSGETDFEGTVEDRGEFEPGEDLESRTGNGLDIGESEGMVIVVSAGDCELLDKGGKDVDENVVVSTLEVEESEQSDTIGLRDVGCEFVGEVVENLTSEGTVEDRVEGELGEDLESRTGSGLELGVSEGTVIVSADKSGERVEENVVVSISEVGESEQSDTIGLGDAEYELGKVEAEVGEEEAQERTELKSVEGDLEMKDQGNFRQTKDLGSAESGESRKGVITLTDTGEYNKSVKAVDVEQDLAVSPVDFGEGSQSNTVSLRDDICESAEIQAGIEVDVEEGKLKDKTEPNSVESLESDIRTTKSVDCVSHDLEKNQFKFEHMTALDSEIDGGAQMDNEISAVEDKRIICTAAADDVKDLDKCIDGSQSVDKLDLTPPDAATTCSMDKVPIECGENITPGTDDCAAVEHEASKSVLVQGIGAVNSTELDSNINQTCAELIGHVPAKKFGGVLASIDDGTFSDQGPFDTDYGVGQVQGYDAQIVALDTNGTTTETDTRSVIDQCKISQIILGEQRSGCTKSSELNGNPDNAHSDCIVPQVQSDKILQSDCNGATIIEPEVRNLVCPITDKSELEIKHLHTEDVESGIFSVTDGTKSETEVANGLSSCASNDMRSEIKIEFGTIDSADVVTKSSGRNSLFKSQVLNGEIDCNRKQAIFMTNIVESEGCADMSSKSDVQNRSDMLGEDATVAECSIGDNVDGQSQGIVAKAKPFQFLAKFPRIDDDKLREQIRDAQELVEEKTVLRNNIRCEIEIKRADLQSLGDGLESTRSDERAVRRLVKLKRQEIDSVQDKINRAKNSISVMDITNRIAHMEHMIEHETHPLKEEKQLLREINVMKKLRGQISSNVCSAEEVTQALSQLEPTEMQLKTLKKELSDIKNKVSKAEAASIQLGKKYNDESKKLRELQARFQAANDIRQDAYKDLLGLKRQLHDKGKHFWIYKDDAKAASDYALNGDKEALFHFCAKQVDTFMDLWNKNDEFREDYVRCNMKSTLRRLKTLDGRSLGPDEEVHVFPVYVGERESRQLNNPSRATNPSSPTIMKQENTVQPVEREPIDGKSLVMVEPKSKMLKSKISVNPIPESGLHIGFRQLEVEETKEEEKQQTKEELELARKDEILRKEEIHAKLKEQLRQKEKVKAQEALERKKRNADKAQMRALSRAQKEAEQKEKEREKRLRKKEKNTTDGENGLELQTNHIKEESKDSPTTKPIKTSHFNRYNKTKATIPPALRNRGKRPMKQFMWWISGALIVLFIFLVANSGAFKNLRPRKDDSFLGNHQSAQPIWQS
ncbi:putative microtubule-associated protein futsch [Heracleum sosnowskyi]|uniref:Microtubule-associated protein futsch n=1 Tax=Heracleum sosnowskyi TaxID=360622 RepID=A0AAD8J452_9APIA|nr:putative microtubule-associated protein futsch [Heracleum sosnowskyi]